MVPVFVHVALKLKGMIEDKVNEGESKFILSSYMTKTTLEIIGLVGKEKKGFSFYIWIYKIFNS